MYDTDETTIQSYQHRWMVSPLGSFLPVSQAGENSLPKHQCSADEFVLARCDFLDLGKAAKGLADAEFLL